MDLAVIGMGNMGAKYAAMVLTGRVPGIRLTAVTRVNAAGAEALNGCLPETVPIYRTAEDLFAAYDGAAFSADAVLVVTPHYSHEAIVKAAFARGLSVLCDKPAGVYSRQARQMNEAFAAACAACPAGEKPPVYAMMFQQRALPVYRKLREIVQSGQYGGIKRVNWVVTDWYRPNAYYTAAAWRGTWAKDGGGTLLNQCPHNLDLLQWICGRPARVQAFCHCGKYHPIEVEDDVTAYMEWTGGATGVFIASTGEAPGINRLEISLDDALAVCENGTLRLKVLDKPEKEYRAGTGDFFAEPVCTWGTVPCPAAQDPYEVMLANFRAACTGGEAPIAPGEQGIYSLLLSNAMYLSAWQHTMIAVPEPGSADETAFETAYESELNKRR